MRVLGRTVYRRLEWMELPLHPLPPEVDPLVPVEFGFLRESDIEEIAALRPGIDAQDRACFARGDGCFGARHDGRIVTISWFTTDVARIDYLGLACALRPGSGYRLDVCTDPQMRGLRIAPALLSRMSRLVAAEGIDTSVTTVLRENHPAVSNVLRVGYRPVGVVGWVGVGPLRRRFLTRRADARPGLRTAEPPVPRPEPAPGGAPDAVRRDEPA